MHNKRPENHQKVCTVMSEKQQPPNERPIIKVYKRRWVVLTIYILCAAVSAFQWIEYSIITNIIMKFYNVSSVAVDWTAVIYMVLYTPLIIPASYIIDKKGIRTAVFIGGFTTALGTILKVFSVKENLFWLVMVCQSILSVSQTVLASLPPKLAAVWFGPNQVSTACALGIFGTQLGVALGFILPPMLVKNHEDTAKIGDDLYFLTWLLSGFMIPVAIAIVVYFPNQPPLPPSQAQLNERNDRANNEQESFITSFKGLLCNKAFLIHTMACGISGSVFSTVATFLNQFTLHYFEHNEEDAGRLGLLLVVVGMVGSVAIGVILDKTKRYKLISFIVYFLTFLSMIAYLIAMECRSMVTVYIIIVALGLFTGAYQNVGFEMSVELTYPSSESTASGIMLSILQIQGTVVTLITGLLNAKYGCFWAILSLVVLLLFGTIIAGLTPNQMRRQAASEERQKHLDVEYKNVPTSEVA